MGRKVKKKPERKKVIRKTKRSSKVTKRKSKKFVDKDVDIENVIGKLAKSFQLEIISEDSEDTIPYYIPYRHKGLQLITGGVPGGRFGEIQGDSQSGKSFLLYELGFQAIDMGGVFVLADVERAFQPSYGKRVGLRGNKKFVLSKARNMQKIFNSFRKVVLGVREVNKSCPILLGIDSYPPIQTFLSEEETEQQLKEGGAKQLKGYREAKKNALFNQLLGEFITFLEENNTTLIILNQLKEKLGVVFGDSATVNADSIIRFYSTWRIRGKLGPKIKNDDGDKIGVNSRWETIKNRNVIPFLKVSTEILYKTGINKYSGLQEFLMKRKVIGKAYHKVDGKKKIKKGYFAWGKKRYANEKFNKFIKKYPQILENLEL